MPEAILDGGYWDRWSMLAVCLIMAFSLGGEWERRKPARRGASNWDCAAYISSIIVFAEYAVDVPQDHVWSWVRWGVYAFWFFYFTRLAWVAARWFREHPDP